MRVCAGDVFLLKLLVKDTCLPITSLCNTHTIGQIHWCSKRREHVASALIKVLSLFVPILAAKAGRTTKVPESAFERSL